MRFSATLALVAALCVPWAPAHADSTGACGARFIAPGVSSYNATEGDNGTLIGAANSTGPMLGWAAASLPIALPQPSAVSPNWTICGTSENNKAVVFNAPLLAAPSTPVLAQTVGGSQGARTRYVKVTFTNLAGETVGSAEASFAISANNLLRVGTPASSGNATGWNVYVGTASGNETKQNASPLALGSNWTEPLGGLISGAALPSSGTAPLAYILDGDRSLQTYLIGTGNYQSATLTSDGTNFRVAFASQESRLFNGATNGDLARILYPGGPGYQTTEGDNNYALSSGATSGGLTVTLPSITAIAAGWKVRLFRDAGKSLLVQTNATAGGSITFPGGSTTSMALPSYDGQFVDLLFDGAVFRIVSRTGGHTEVDATDFGVRCDGATNDSPGTQAAANSLPFGGDVRMPANGNACLWATGISVPNNVHIRGTGTHHWPGLSGTIAQWAAQGTSIECGDTVNACLKHQSVGSGASDLNFIYAQPDPSPGWTPTTYPFTIEISGSANYNSFERISITAASHCINMQGPSSGIAGIGTIFRDIYFNGCWKEGLRMEKIDNTVRFYDLKYDFWWHRDSADVQAYVKAHRDGMILKYAANPQFYGTEFFLVHRALVLQNGSVTSGFGTLTFATNNAQFFGVSFNEVCKAIDLPDGNGTITSGMMTNILAWGDTITNCTASNPVMFDLPSDSANWSLSQIETGHIQTLASIGAGGGGVLRLTDLSVQAYSAFGAGAPAIEASANCSLSITGTPLRSIRPLDGTAGPILGPGVSGQCYVEPLLVGTLGGVEGGMMLKSSQNNTTAGSLECYMPDGTRTCVFGRSSAAHEVNLTAELGDLNLFPAAGHVINLTGPVKTGIYTVGALPACNSTTNSARVTVSDLLTFTAGAAPTGGGGMSASVTCTNGTGWRLQ